MKSLFENPLSIPFQKDNSKIERHFYTLKKKVGTLNLLIVFYDMIGVKSSENFKRVYHMIVRFIIKYSALKRRFIR